MFNHGHHTGDFTYVEEIVKGTMRVTDPVPGLDSAWNRANPGPAFTGVPYRLYNIGSNNRPIELLRDTEMLEDRLVRRAERIMKPPQLGDVPDTYADVVELIADVGYKPDTPIEVGVCNFVEWFNGYSGYG